MNIRTLIYGTLLLATVIWSCDRIVDTGRNEADNEFVNADPFADAEWELVLENVHGSMAADPNDSDILYLAASRYSASENRGFWKSTDAGETWEKISDECCQGIPNDILIHPDDPQTIMVSGRTGNPGAVVMTSSDGGYTWSYKCSGIYGSSHGNRGYGLAYERSSETYFLADDARMIEHSYRSKDGENWEAMQLGATFCMEVDEEAGVVYACGYGIRRSSDSGDNWTYITRNGLPVWESQFSDRVEASQMYDLARVPGSRTLYAATSQGIYKSYDQAETWESANNSLTKGLQILGGIAVSSRDTNMVFAGVRVNPEDEYQGGIFMSYDGGDSWDWHNDGLPVDAGMIFSHHIFWDDASKTLYSSKSQGQVVHLYRLRAK